MGRVQKADLSLQTQERDKLFEWDKAKGMGETLYFGMIANWLLQKVAAMRLTARQHNALPFCPHGHYVDVIKKEE